MQSFTPTFTRPATLDEATANTLRLIEEGAPLTLEEVAWACATYGVSATLYTGDHTSARELGTVDADGNYRLA